MNRYPSAGNQDAGGVAAQPVCTPDPVLHRPENVVERERRFAAEAAHDLRTPLAALRLQLEEALMYSDTDPRSALTTALRCLDRLQQAITDLLPRAHLNAPHGPC